MLLWPLLRPKSLAVRLAFPSAFLPPCPTSFMPRAKSPGAKVWAKNLPLAVWDCLASFLLKVYSAEPLSEHDGQKACGCEKFVEILRSFGLLRRVRCRSCRSWACLVKVSHDTLAYRCSRLQDRWHFAQNVNFGVLQHVHAPFLMEWLCFLNLIRLNVPFKQLFLNLAELGASKRTLQYWLTYFYRALALYHQHHPVVLGGKGSVVVVDEASMGTVGQMVGKRPLKLGGYRREPRSASKKARTHIAKRLPGRTIWKAGVLKRPAAIRTQSKGKAGTSDDKRHSARWIWVGVQRGDSRKRLLSHEDSSKKVVLHPVPTSAQAIGGKPRGAQQLAQIMGAHLHPGTTVVSDGWRGTKGACKMLKVAHKTVDHRSTFRSEEGFHSNDAESEISRFRRWLRAKYGSNWSGPKGEHSERLRGILAEYQILTNSGEQMVVGLRFYLDIMLNYHVAGAWSLFC